VLLSVALAIAVPALIAGAALLLFGRRTFVAPLAIAAAYCAGHLLVRGAPLPIRETTDWLFWVAVAGGIAGAGLSFKPDAVWLRIGVATVLAAGMAYTASGPKIRWVWSRGEAAAWIAGITIATALVWVSLDTLGRTLSARWFAFASMVLAAGVAVLLGATGSALLGQLGGALAAGVGAAWVVTLLRPTTGVRAAAAVLGLLILALWLNGHFYAETPMRSSAVLALPLGGAALLVLLQRSSRSR
jgi:hypothetical protein